MWHLKKKTALKKINYCLKTEVNNEEMIGQIIKFTIMINLDLRNQTLHTDNHNIKL